jgi:hypothetical protein
MPGGNGTGPMGAGPMTGRAMGYCAGVDVRSGFGRGMRMGCGRGFGFRNRFFANGVQQAPAMTAEQEKEYMQNNIKALENELEAAKERLKEL